MSEKASEVSTDQATEGQQQTSGSDNLGWRAALPDDLKNHDFVKDYAKPGDAIRDFVALKQEAGNMLKVPGEQATDEERTAFFAKLGKPESADKYALDVPAELPAQYTPELESTMRNLFLSANLTNQQAKAIHGEYLNMLKAGEAFEKAETEKAINSLKDEWKGDTFKLNTELAERAFKKFGGESAESLIQTKINGVALGDHPVFLKVFAAIGNAISDDSLSAGRNNTQRQMSDEDRAKARFPTTYK